MDMLLDALVDAGTDALISQFGSLIQQAMGIVVLISLPILALAVAYCFFGIKIVRILLVISGVFGGGAIGALIIGIASTSVGGAVAGFLLGAVIGGMLAWFAYKVFLFIEAFFTGFLSTALLLLVLTGSISASIAIGLIVGIALGVFICIYTNLFIMIMTAYKGADSIASILSLLFITSGAYKPMRIVLLIVFAVAGFYVQYRFFSDVDARTAKRSGKGNGKKYQFVGIDGMYKGFEFDIDENMVFGRDAESCNVVFPDTCAGISRVQCQIMWDKNTNSVSIIDKYSTYGTTLNGVKLELNRPTTLSEGDVVMFGENNVFKLITKQ